MRLPTPPPARLRPGAQPVGEVVLVAGPPGAGKTHHIRAHLQPGELHIDYDALYVALTGQRYPHRTPADWYTHAAFKHLVSLLRTDPQGLPRAWVAHTAPKAATRGRYRRIHRARVVVVATPLEVCAERIRADPDRPAHAHDALIAAAGDWWRDYEPDGRDQVIRP